jgi:hypothetical protein
MAVIQIGSTTLAKGGSKGADGENNSNRIAVTTLAELQAGTANKIWSIQGDIDLGTTTLNIPSGVEDATWLIKDNIFEGVLLNTTLATEMNNYEN